MTIAQRMADAIIQSGADLGDEREVIAALVASGFSDGEINANLYQATECARVIRVQRESEAIGAYAFCAMVVLACLSAAFVAEKLWL